MGARVWKKNRHFHVDGVRDTYQSQERYVGRHLKPEFDMTGTVKYQPNGGWRARAGRALFTRVLLGQLQCGSDKEAEHQKSSWRPVIG